MIWKWEGWGRVYIHKMKQEEEREREGGGKEEQQEEKRNRKPMRQKQKKGSNNRIQEEHTLRRLAFKWRITKIVLVMSLKYTLVTQSILYF